MADRIGDVLEGKYRLQRVLGRGGMGVVYEAEHTVINRRMAVKMLHSEHLDSDEMAQRFLQEAQSASAVHHPNVIEIQDVGRGPDGAIFIVMQLLDGRSLSSLLAGGARLEPVAAVGITRQVLAGLTAAHAARIVHRDLKPDNVFLTQASVTGRTGEQVKILDFGISKGVAGGPEAGLTRTGAVLGTAWYMAPEQARGDKDLDERADLWAVGVMLHQMLTGRLPFAGDSYNAVLAQILTEPVPPCATRAPEVDPALAAVVDKALAKDRQERFQTAAELDRALAPFGPDADAPLALPASPAADDSEAAHADTAATDAVDADPATAETRAAKPKAAFEPTAALKSPKPDPPEAATAPARPPVWKRALWWVLTALVLAPLVLAGLSNPVAMLRAFGLPGHLHPALAYGLLAVLFSGLGGCALLLYRAWPRGRTDRWLHGPVVLTAPAVSLALALLHYFTLSGQKTSHQVSLRAYSAVTTTQATRMSKLIGDSHEQFLSALAVDQLVVTLLGLLLLFGWLFFPRPGPGAPRGRLRWLALPAGLAVVVVAHTLVAPRALGFMGFLVFPLYGVWALATVVALRQPATPTPTPAGWAALGTALVTCAALTASQIATGYLQLFEAVGRRSPTGMSPAEREHLFRTVVAPNMVWGTVAQWGVLLVLFGLTWAFARRGLPSLGRASRRPVLLFSLALLIAVVPVPVLLSAMREASEQWAPHKFARMQPVTRPGESEPTYYLDRRPQSLVLGRRLLYRTLARGKRLKRPKASDVRRLLAGRKACPGLLDRALTRPSAEAPARCITAIEARLYCEALGKRLPTPREWDDALGRLKPGPAPAADPRRLVRGDFAEWTMRKVHGTATFELRGGPAGAKPDRLPPNRFSRQVGFRCAFTFPGD